MEEGLAGTASRVDRRLRLRDFGMLCNPAQACLSRKLEAYAVDVETDVDELVVE